MIKKTTDTDEIKRQFGDKGSVLALVNDKVPEDVDSIYLIGAWEFKHSPFFNPREGKKQFGISNVLEMGKRLIVLNFSEFEQNIQNKVLFYKGPNPTIIETTSEAMSEAFECGGRKVATLESWGDGKILYIVRFGNYGPTLSKEDVTRMAVPVSTTFSPWRYVGAGEERNGYKTLTFKGRKTTILKYKGLECHKNDDVVKSITVQFPKWEYAYLGDGEVRLEEAGAHLNKKSALFTVEGVRLGTYHYAIGGIRPRQVSVYETSPDERRNGWTTYEAAPEVRASSWEWETDVIPWSEIDLSAPQYHCRYEFNREEVKKLRDAPFTTHAEFLAAKAKFEADRDADIQKAADEELARLNA